MWAELQPQKRHNALNRQQRTKDGPWSVKRGKLPWAIRGKGGLKKSRKKNPTHKRRGGK